MDELTLTPIAHMRSEFTQKFGIPRQSGLVEDLRGTIIFTPPFRTPDALRGIEGFSHLWLLWGFHQAKRDTWAATVRPPRLGGNERLGVFATRSPYRPNPLGLSCVRLERVELQTSQGPVLHVLGADLMDGTPIYDIKPYVPYADSHPEAGEGFASTPGGLEVVFPGELLELVPPDRREALRGVLACDPRPHYQRDPQRVYGMTFAGLEVKFTVDGRTLTVREVQPHG